MIHTDQLGYEKTDSDTHWRNKVPLMLLCCQHKDSEHQLRCQKHLYDHSLGHGSASAEGGANVEVAMEQHFHQCSGYHTSEYLSNEEEHAADPGYSTDHDHADSDLQTMHMVILATQKREK